MARLRKSALAFDAITLEGSLISPGKLAEVAERRAGEQSEADYHIPKGLTLRDETARYFRIGQALFRELFSGAHPSQQATIRFTHELLRDVFGFGDIHPVTGPKVKDDRSYILQLEALQNRVPVVVVPPSDDIDHASAHLSNERRRSAATAIQDWLNAEQNVLWGLCCNGERLRLLRDNESLTRPAYIEANLRQLFEAEDFAGFSALWLMLHASRFGRPGTPVTDCALERWREAGGKEGLAARARLSVGVKDALQALGNGFLSHPANSILRDRLTQGQLPLPDFFNELLRLVYRLIFLLAAEDRDLLHPADTPPRRPTSSTLTGTRSVPSATAPSAAVDGISSMTAGRVCRSSSALSDMVSHGLASQPLAVCSRNGIRPISIRHASPTALSWRPSSDSPGSAKRARFCR
jgi:hypothetical protein